MPSPLAELRQMNIEGQRKAAQEQQPEPEGNITSNITAHIAEQKEIHEESNAEAQMTAKKTTQKRSKPEARPSIQEMMDSDPAPITLRLPKLLNAEVDKSVFELREVRLSGRRKVLKQDFMALAVARLLLDLESGRNITDLLDEVTG